MNFAVKKETCMGCRTLVSPQDKVPGKRSLLSFGVRPVRRAIGVNRFLIVRPAMKTTLAARSGV
jgi:hypothetical protein